MNSVLNTEGSLPLGRGGHVRFRRFDREVHRKRRVKTIAGIATALVVAVAVAVVVGVAVLLGSIDSHLSLGDSNAASALKASSKEGTFYSLVLADFSLESDSAPERSRRSSDGDSLAFDVSDNAIDGLASNGSSASASITVGSTEQAQSNDAFALVHVDTNNRTAQVVAIPSNVTSTGEDGLLYTLSDVWDRLGDAGVVEAVSSLAGVPITHVLKVDAQGLKSLVDAVGGISVEVGEEIDDPRAGSVYLASGQQQVDGSGALTMVRATNLSGGSRQIAENRIEVLRSVSVKLLSFDSLAFFSMIDQLPGCIRTDESTGEVNHLLSAMGAVGADAVSGVVLPGEDIMRDGISIYRVSESTWADYLKNIGQGMAPVVDEVVVSEADPSSFTVFVKNGSGVSGAAASISGSLEERGFNVEGIGNTDIEAYDETLVIYGEDEYEDAAQRVVQELGMGRIVSDYAGFYQLETDVLVIVGRDWKPSE